MGRALTDVSLFDFFAERLGRCVHWRAGPSWR
ncbi:hypothetical protein MXAN_0688 [Myxococcus xanthus DK 1622]|uniref:Uncharacterized protein n=1 Tax=Myxococcus xanthus (strain DK1622) TaxID=246197 RepID=Q1DEG7_MYXXD|nr:hypothetical protein MXAN_0688 [Myxococcus xanthus DK 1622]QLH55573.1 hypothetical protein [Myxococcus xanthus DK 1622]